MSAHAPLETLSRWAYDELFKRYPLDLASVCSRRPQLFCEVLAEKLGSIDTLAFTELLITLATISKRCQASAPDDATATHPNLFMIPVSPTSSGKTAVYIPFCKVRTRRLELTNIPTDASFGTDMGAISSIETVALAGGAALLTADEGLDELTKFLTERTALNGAKFGAARSLNMLFCGTPYTRAYKTMADVQLIDCHLSLLAAGTPVHFDAFRELFTLRGAQDGFRTRVLPVFNKKKPPPAVAKLPSEEETQLRALSAEQLMALFEESFIALARWFESDAWQAFVFGPAATRVLNAKKLEIRERETAEQTAVAGETAGQTWRRITQTPLPNQQVPDERHVELTKKVAISLHVMEVLFSWINFTTCQTCLGQVPLEISATSVRAAAAFVLRSREQEMFYEKMLKHCSGAVHLRKRIIPEHADIVLYPALTTLFLLWPGPKVTWEAVVDRFAVWFLSVSLDQCMEALDTLTDYGNRTRNAAKRFESGGAKVILEEPTRTFRFYKTLPALIEPTFLKRFGVHMDDYKARFEMEYKQVKEAHCWSRGHLLWKDLIQRTPAWISRKRKQGDDDVDTTTATDLEFLGCVSSKCKRLDQIRSNAEPWQREWIANLERVVACNKADTKQT